MCPDDLIFSPLMQAILSLSKLSSRILFSSFASFPSFIQMLYPFTVWSYLNSNLIIAYYWSVRLPFGPIPVIKKKTVIPRSGSKDSFLSQLYIIIMEYLRWAMYEVQEVHFDSGFWRLESKVRLGGPIGLGLWQGQHILAGACGRESGPHHDLGSRERRQERRRAS